MKLQKSSGQLKRPKFIIRRVEGQSMLPLLKPGKIIIGIRTRNLSVGHVVIIKHDGLEKVKRIAATHPDEIYVLGDNAIASTDSRMFGWIPESTVVARVIWPRM